MDHHPKVIPTSKMGLPLPFPAGFGFDCDWDGPLLKWKWLGVNKGDADPKIRSRMVEKEVKKAKPLHEQLGGSDVFSATPPIEAVCTVF